MIKKGLLRGEKVTGPGGGQAVITIWYAFQDTEGIEGIGPAFDFMESDFADLKSLLEELEAAPATIIDIGSQNEQFNPADFLAALAKSFGLEVRFEGESESPEE